MSDSVWCIQDGGVSARRVSFQLFPIAKETGFAASLIAAKRHTSLLGVERSYIILRYSFA